MVAKGHNWVDIKKCPLNNKNTITIQILLFKLVMWHIILNSKSQTHIIKEEYNECLNLYMESVATRICPENFKGVGVEGRSETV